MAIISLLLLAALLPQLGHSAKVGIVNGTNAIPHSRPYMVSFQLRGKHSCGGFLVSERFVITAAHCKPVNWNEATVVVGAHDLTTNDFERIRVEEHYSHPGFTNDPQNPVDDIMVLKLEKSTANTKNAALISIPKINEKIKQDTICSIAGWGLLTDNGPQSKVLQEAKVTMLSSWKCKEQWESSNLLCTDVLYSGFCKGDSGGPLVCDNVAVGIVSAYTGSCQTPEKPYAYTRISAFLPWIKAIMGKI